MTCECRKDKIILKIKAERKEAVTVIQCTTRTGVKYMCDVPIYLL